MSILIYGQDVYSIIDVLLLFALFENFRKNIFKECDLDPVRCVTVS